MERTNPKRIKRKKRRKKQIMTRTIYLNPETGAIEFDTNGMLKMIGTPNQIDQKEVKQRVSIRFLTQTRSNILHPSEGFDFLLLQSMDRGRTPPQELIEQEIDATLDQDRDVSRENREITVEGPNVDREFDLHLKYSIKGSYNEQIEFSSSLGAF